MKFNLTSLNKAASKITEDGFSRDISDPVWDGGMGGGHLKGIIIIH